MLLVLAGVLVLVLAALARPQLADASVSRVSLVEQIADYRSETWRWQQLMGKPRTPTSYSERKVASASYRTWVRDLWRNRALAAEQRAANPPHRSQWLCIHRYERHPAQGWATRTGNGYYGGLQMDISFQRTYGAEILRREGHREQLVGARADVGRRARPSQRSGLLSLAEHRSLLRLDLGGSSSRRARRSRR